MQPLAQQPILPVVKQSVKERLGPVPASNIEPSEAQSASTEAVQVAVIFIFPLSLLYAILFFDSGDRVGSVYLDLYCLHAYIFHLVCWLNPFAVDFPPTDLKKKKDTAWQGLMQYITSVR